MKVNQELSILFWLWKAKQTSDGMVPIYVRITLNGLRDQFSSGKKIRAEYWNEETGFAIKACKDAATINTYRIYRVYQTDTEPEHVCIDDPHSWIALGNLVPYLSATETIRGDRVFLTIR